MQTHSSDWQLALQLLDDALAVPEDERDQWLSTHTAVDPGVAALLRKLLNAHGRVETHELLATLPRIRPYSPSSDDIHQAGMQVGPFALIEPLGRGGMGSVWRARYADERLKRDVAVKLPLFHGPDSTLTGLRERFARERDFLAQLEHPHIARLYDAGITPEGQPFLAMELVTGISIDAYCDQRALSCRDRLQLFCQVLDAVTYAHQQLVLHRDLKPGNVLVDQQGQVRLLDFGVARLLPAPMDIGADKSGLAPIAQTELTEMAGVAITLRYAAPEQIQRAALSTATDVYALGVMLYYLLTGFSPYQPARETRGALEDAILLTTPALASSRKFSADILKARQTTEKKLTRSLRGDLDTILAKALKKSASERYASVAELAQDIRCHLASQPIAARADSLWYRISRFTSRNRVAVWSSGLVACALVITAGVAVWQAKLGAENAARASREAVRANAAQRFFSGLFAKADPEKNMNNSIVDRQIIDHALLVAEGDFADSPETLSLILKQLGEIYDRLGVFDKYLEVLKKRANLVSGMKDVPIDEWVDAQVLYWQAQGESRTANESALALPGLKTTLERAQREKASSESLVMNLSLIATQLILDFKFKEAEDYAQRAIVLAEKPGFKSNEWRAQAYNEHGTAVGKLGKFDTARADFKRSLELDSAPNGRGVMSQLQTRSLLANLEYNAGDYAAAKRESMDALEFARLRVGNTDSGRQQLYMRVILSSERLGQLDEAHRLVPQLLADDLASTDGFRRGRALYTEGTVAMARGEYALASKAFQAADSAMALHPTWGPILNVQQATLMLRQNDNQNAYRLLVPVLNHYRQMMGTANSEFPKASERAGVALARMGRTQEAQQSFGEACEWRRATLKKEHPERIRCESYLVLIASDIPLADKMVALRKQLSLLVDKPNGQSPLGLSLQAALTWLERQTRETGRIPDFPLIN